MPEFGRSVVVIFVLLNPFLMSIYLLDLIQEKDIRTFSQSLISASGISVAVFSAFALVGDAIFTQLLQVNFASFLIFGGFVFLIVGVRFVFSGEQVLQEMRGGSETVGASIAMPFMIGPATVSAAVLTGSRLDAIYAVVAITLAVVMSMLALIALKWTYDALHQRHEDIVRRYVAIVGRVMALVIGTLAVEMIVKGVKTWIGEL